MQKHYQKAKKAFKISKEACQLNADITSLFSQSKTDEDVQKSETSLCQNIFFLFCELIYLYKTFQNGALIIYKQSK